MSSVTERIAQVRQPHGGYVRIRDFQSAQTDDGYVLGEENIHPTLVGLAVDYLTRFMLGDSIYDAFRISISGAELVGQRKKAEYLISNIRGLDDNSVLCVCQLCGYDVCYRNSPACFKPVEQICPDIQTIQNIRIMVQRTLSFFDQNGPVIKMGFTFEGGYTDIVTHGDGDYLTKTTLWDLKVSIKEPTSRHSLQLLMYYLLGKNSVHEEFKEIEHIGIYNPRINKVYMHPVSMISDEVINEVAIDVIGYSNLSDEDGLSAFVDGFEEDERENLLPELMNVNMVCEWLKIKREEVYKLLCEGELIAGKDTYQYGIRRDSLFAFHIRNEVRKNRMKKRRFKLLMIGVFFGILALFYFIIRGI